MRINRAAAFVEIEVGFLVEQVHVRAEECMDRPDVFPVAIEHVGVYPAAADCARDELSPEIMVAAFGKKLKQHLAAEEINAHGGKVRSLRDIRGTSGLAQHGGIDF